MTINSHYSLRKLSDNAFLLEDNFQAVPKKLISLNESSAYIWTLISKNEFTSIDDMVTDYAGHYQINIEEAWDDIRTTLEKWKSLDLIYV